MSPQTKDLDDSLIFKNLIDQPVLNISNFSLDPVFATTYTSPEYGRASSARRTVLFDKRIALLNGRHSYLLDPIWHAAFPT